jgi:hypothetical protein
MKSRQRHSGLHPEEHSVTKFMSSLAIAGTLLALAAVPANAQTRTFVSGSGTDSGACPRAAPCRTFAYVITQTAAHGEIAVLDTAGYGPLTISKSISIVNPGGVEAGIAATAGGTAITINAGLTDIVALRGLTIEGAQSGQYGIVLNTGGVLEIENCVVRDFTQNAIYILPTGTTAFHIGNTMVSDNGHDGILVVPSGTNGTAQGVIDHVAAFNNVVNGIAVAGINTTSTTAITVAITNSVASNNAAAGIYSASSASHAPVTVTVSNTTASNNATGLIAGNGPSGSLGTIQITQTLVTANTTGVAVANSGIVNTFGDNDINLNGTDVSGSLTAVTPK